MTSTEKTFTIEGYAVFRNVDSSVLLLNPVLEDYGFKFVTISVAEFEENFSALLNIPKNFTSEMTVNIEDMEVSWEFCQLLSSNPEFRIPYENEYKYVFLKQLDQHTFTIINNSIDRSDFIEPQINLDNFTRSLVQSLRLFKNGDVESNIQFQIEVNDRSLIGQAGKIYGPLHSRSIMQILPEDIPRFRDHFTLDFTPNDLVKLALENFNTTYSVMDTKVKFITLMTSLESLFNQGRDQITHIVSRHLSLIISQNVSEFTTNYSRIKKLYKMRSEIVHGSKVKGNIYEGIEDLQNLVRHAINYCQTLSITKKQLFEKLNAAGVNSLNG